MPGENIKSVYVARTVSVSPEQKRLDRLLRDIARPLGRGAQILNSASTHLTFLESQGVKEKFYDFGYTPDVVVDFKQRLQRHLNKNGHDEKTKVQLNRERTLGLFGCSLALMVDDSPQLTDQRGRIETFLVSQFGELPDLKPFDPHVTIGAVQRSLLTAEITADPDSLLPSQAAVPQEITLNGLEVYLGNIHPYAPKRYKQTLDPTIAASLAGHHEDMHMRGV